MASTKRDLPFDDEFQLKKARVEEREPFSSSAASSNIRVVINPADCDIDFNIEGDGLQGSALYEEGFAYCWSGARASIGITRGKYCFGCKIISAQPVNMEDTPLDLQHVCRVGISRGDDDVRNLGETLNSFGFGGTGKFSNSGNFPNYGERFGVGDTIVCAVDLESLPLASISFSKNGNWLGVAKHFDAGPNGLGVVGSPVKRLHWGSALFPHVLLKNVVVQLQFSVDNGLNPIEGYKPWDAAILDGNAMLGPAFSKIDDCEVIMMVGLPASRKTTWAEKWVKEHPEKRYVLLGMNLALEQMEVPPGLLRKHNYSERFKLLMDLATKNFNVLLSRASKIPRNFIIDQTNVYKSARKRKLKPFADFRKIAAVVFPRGEELKVHAGKRFKEMGKEVPVETVNQMLANYTSMPECMQTTSHVPIRAWTPAMDEYCTELPPTEQVQLGIAYLGRAMNMLVHTAGSMKEIEDSFASTSDRLTSMRDAHALCPAQIKSLEEELARSRKEAEDHRTRAARIEAELADLKQQVERTVEDMQRETDIRVAQALEEGKKVGVEEFKSSEEWKEYFDINYVCTGDEFIKLFREGRTVEDLQARLDTFKQANDLMDLDDA